MEKHNHRKPNGKRLEGHSLATRIAQEVTGTTLARAFVVAKSAGFRFKINKLDGVPMMSSIVEGVTTVIVDVVSGMVKKSWAT